MMELSKRDEFVIKQYEQDEEMMILIFAQWCVNHDLDPMALYRTAYPTQPKNPALEYAMKNTVPKESAENISTETVQHVLQLFGNDDLAFIIQEEMDKKRPKK